VLEAMGYYEQPISSEFLVMVPMAFERNLLTNSDLDILLISMDIYGYLWIICTPLLGRGCHTWLLWKKGEADAVP